MKLQIPFFSSRRARLQTPNHGFTLPEILIALTIFLFIIAGITSAHLFGLRLFQMTNTKLRVTQWARLTTENLTDQIHGCYSVQVVPVSTNGDFSNFMDGDTQQGNGLLIYPTATDTNKYILYFVNLGDQTFRRTDQSSNTVELADSVTNTLAFSAQDYLGNVLTNSQNNQVIHVTLEFYHPPTYMESADYFKLETSIKPRVVPQ
jgi:prepilin-type N-terminal cleavage/methylation domain-containing protein